MVATVLLLIEAAVTRHQHNDGDVRTRSRLDTTKSHQMEDLNYGIP